MISAAKRRIGFAAALLAGAVLMQAAFAQAPPPGVFSEIQTAVVPRTSPALEPATMRSRVVQVDTQKITAARRGREVLKLNLFDDAVVEVQIKRVRPTRTGYFISGTPSGMDWGEVRLVVNGPVMVGTVLTPEGKFTIRSAGSGRHVIRQVDAAAEPFECEVQDPPLPRPQQAISSIDQPPSLAQLPSPQADDIPTEDGSEVRILVVYTPALQAAQGGRAGMRALVDLMVQSANQAFEEGGINPRLVLANAAMVDYVAQRTQTDVYRLRIPDDGYMDEVHALRNEYAADLVHLITNVPIGASGSAYRLTRESLSAESFSAFAITANASEETFTHEVGHNLGLRHDRYVNRPSGAIYPYAFGYINLRAFEPGSPRTARWRTVMTYGNGCGQAGIGCSRLLRFSNADQTYLGDPMGVAADDPETGTAGPADARLTINNTAPWVGSFRSEACSDITVPTTAGIAPVDGGEIAFEVRAGPGCLWGAESHSDFLNVVAGAPGAGNGYVTIEIEANSTGAERSGTLTVAGKTITLRQLATTQGICGRTAAVMHAIAKASGFAGAQQCGQVSDAHLSGIGILVLVGEGLSSLEEGDFAGLSGLTRLSLGSNELTDLPEGLFAGLTSLTTLQLGYNELTELPAGLFAGLARLETLRLSSNRLTELPAGVFSGLSSLKSLQLDYNDLLRVPADVFADLTSLEKLLLNSNELAEYPSGLFDGLSNLKTLDLSSNRATELPSGLFADLTQLEELDLFPNSLAAVPEAAFSGLSDLKNLELGQGQFSTLPSGVFAGLSRLEKLNFWDAQLTDLPSGVFSGLSGLKELNLYSNNLRELPAGLFTGLSSLERLVLGKNRIASLPPGVFSGLTALKELNLYRNQLSGLPDGAFSGLPSLEKLYLGSNRIDPLPIAVSLEKTGTSQFRATVSAGAPFALELPVTVGSAGGIAGGADSITIPAGETESTALEVARVAGTEAPVDADIGTLPSPPASHTGYSLTKAPTLPRRILASSLASDATLITLSINQGTLDPLFDKHSTSYTATVAHAASFVTITHTKSNSNASVAYFDSSDQTLADADTASDGHQVDLDVGSNTIQIRVTAPDGTTVRTYTLVIARDDASDVCGRTPQVREAIVSASGVSGCADVTSAHLSAITKLSFGVTSLQSGDFAGLNALVSLNLWDIQVSSLPGDVFSDLVALEDLRLGGSNLNRLPVEVFSSLKALTYLHLSDNRLVGLQRGHFAGLESLKRLDLSDNGLDSLPADTFSGLPGLTLLSLSFNRFRQLPPQLFSGLSALKQLYLRENQISELSAGIFSELSELEALSLSENQLSRLPNGLLSGLDKLEFLDLRANKFDPLPLPIALESVGQGQFKLVAPTGAPFALSVPVTVSSSGEIEGGATAVSIPAGSLESAVLTVTRVTGSTDAITAEFDPMMALPLRHKGYYFKRDDSLPKEIVPSTAPTEDAALRLLSLSPGALSPSFDSGTTSYSVTVPNAAASVTLTPTTSSANAAVSILDANDSALSDADAAKDGFQVDLYLGENTFKVQVTAEDTTTTRTYTLVVTRNSAPQISTSAQVSVEENVTEVVTLTATDANGDDITWLTNGGADAGRFDLTADGVLTFESAPDFEQPDDLDEDNVYLVVMEASDGLEVSYLNLSVSVADVDESAPKSDDASLSALGLSAGALISSFASATTNYTAKVAANVSSITVTPTTGHTNATIEYLDRSDQTLGDADVSIDGQQVGLDPAANTIKVKVTAEDTTTSRTYTIVVTRNRLPEITTSSPVFVAENETAVATLAATDADGDDIRWTTSGGADEGKFDLDVDGVLTFASAPDYEHPADADADNEYVLIVRATDGTDTADLTLTVKVTDVDDSLSNDTRLSGLLLSVGTLDPVFASGVTSYAATVANGVSSITVTPTRSDATATLAYLDGADAELDDADDNTAGHQVDLEVGANTIKVQVTAEDTTTLRTYTIVVTREDAPVISGGVCDRTEQVRDAIVAAVSGVDACADVTESHLSAITSLDLSDEGIGSLQSGDFEGLTGLAQLVLEDNDLTGLPSDLLDGLSALEKLNLKANDLSALPSGVFDDPGSLSELYLGGNRLSAVPAEVISGLSTLELLGLADNQLSALGSDDFSGLSSLEILFLGDNQLTSFPSDVFSGLSALQELWLGDNQLTSLPAGVFSGLSALAALNLSGNTTDPLPISVSLENVGSSEFKAVAAVGAPFDLSLPVSASGEGGIEDDADTVTVSTGALESAAVGVTRAFGTTGAVTVDIGTLPSLPANHNGYRLERDASLPLAIPSPTQSEPQASNDATLSSLALGHVTMTPAFASATTSYTGSAENAAAVTTVFATASDSNAAVAFLDANDQALEDELPVSDGHQLNLSVGENTIKVQVTAEDGTTTQTYTIVVTRARANVAGEGVCGRTKQVGEAIVAAVEDAKSCDQVTDEQLSRITGLDVSGEEIASLQAGDFGGLGALELLKLSDNQLTGLPVAIFAELAELETLELQNNQLSRLSSDVLCGVGKLKTLNLANNLLPRLAGNQFLCVPDLQSLLLQGNELSEIPDGFFAGLSSFAELDLADNAATPLPLTVSLEKVSDGRFRAVAPTGAPFQLNLPVSVSSSGEIAGGVSSVTIATGSLESRTIEVTRLSGTVDAVTVNLGTLPGLPANHAGYALEKDAALPLEVLPEAEDATGVCDRTEQVRDAIVAAVSGVDECADVTESHLSAITSLDLSDEGIASLQSGDFAGLTGLAQLVLEDNDLTGLPSDLLDGLSALEKLNLKANDLSALPSGVFDDPGSLSELYLGGNRLSAVPADVISGLSGLEILGLADNQLSALGSDDFSGLSSLEVLFLGGNQLSSLPADVFSGLSALQELWLGDNQLTSLPHGVFSGLSALAALNLSGNTTDPLPISVSLENVGSSEFKAVAAVGAPFDLSLPVSASGEGGIEDDADTVTVSTGAVESAAVGVTRAFGTTGAVTVDIGTLPSLPANHSGYRLERDASLPLAIPSPTESERVAGDDAKLSGLSLSSGALSPVFSADIRSYVAAVANSVSSITVTPTKSDTDATVAYLDAIDNDLTDADGSTAGHQVGLSVGGNTIKVKVTAEDTSTTLTYVLVVTRNSVPEITTTSPISVDENETAVALLAATDADSDGISWSKNGGADEAQFNLTTDGELTFVSAPDYESPADAGANNEYVVVVRASDGIDHADLTLTTTVADLDEGAMDDATLIGLTLGLDDTMEPAFASEETSYRARIQYEVSSITVTPTKSNANATVAYFDATDSELVDADTTMDGHQVDLIVGNTTIKVKVTAEDGVATRIYTVVVKRYGEFTSAPIIVTASPISVQENQTKVATLEATDRDDDIILWSIIGGADEDLFNLTTEGVLTFLSAPSFEAPADADRNNQYVVIVEATDDWTGTSVLTLTVIVTNPDEGEVAGDDATLSGLSLSSGALDPAFASETLSYTASVANEVPSVTVTPTLSDLNATLAYQDGSDQALADADANTDGHQVALEVGANTIKVQVTAEDTTTLRTYTLVVTREDAPVVSGGVCDRTEQVRDAIVAAVSGVDACADVTESHLSAITSLDLSDEGIGSLQSGDFAGLTGLAQLILEDNDLTEIPSGLLGGLAALDKLNMKNNDLSALPAGVFDGPGSLSELYLGSNRLSAVPSDVFSGLSGLEILGLAANQLGALGSDDFSGLSSLEVLFLGGNQLSSLPSDVFSGLSALQKLWLGDNQLTSLPDGVFSGLSALAALNLSGNSTDPLPISVSLENVGSSEFKAVAAVGAPFDLSLPVSASGEGGIEDDADTVTVSTGAVESAAVGVTRAYGTTGAVTVDLGTLPALPADHSGYRLERDASLPLAIPSPTESEPVASDDATLSGLSLSSGALDPAFASETVSYTVSVSNEVSSVTVTPTRSDSNATLAYRDGSDQALADADADTSGQQVDLEVGTNTIKVQVTAEDTTTLRTYTLVVTREDAPVVSGGVCARTEQVRDAILAAVSGVDECADVTESHLSAIPSLNLSDEGIGSLQSGDFAGLTGLAQLVLEDNDLTSLPSDLLDGLSALEKLNLKNNDLSALPAGVFDDPGSLSELYLGGNRLSALPSDVFSGLSGLEILGLADNQLGALGSDDFSGLSSLEVLFLGGNQLSSLPADVFSGLSALQKLWLGDNQLTSLPDGVFFGLSALERLNLSGNSTDPLPISVSLENVGSSEFKAVAAVGAPFDLSLPVSASGEGGIEDDADTVTVSTGAVESAAVGVTRAFGTTGAVTVDLGTLPSLPANHSGYRLERDASLPLAIPSPTESEPVASDDAALSGLSLSSGALDPAFASETVSYTVSVSNEVSSVTVTPARSDSNATLAYRDGSDQALADADADTSGQQVDLEVGTNTIKVQVTAEDTTTLRTYTLVVTREDAPVVSGGVCDRTEQVRDAILARITGVDACEDVTGAQLAGIGALSLSNKNLKSLQSGDFAGLTGLTFLSFSFNDLTSVPSDLFAGLAALESLDFVDNDIGNLPAGIFSGLSALKILLLGDNPLGNLPAGIFSGLSALEELECVNCGISSLPANLFSGLGALQDLSLSENELSSLPDGIFSGLNSLSKLKLARNSVDPLALPLSLEKVGESQFKAVVPTGAPFAMDIPVSVSSDGAIEGDADSVTIAAGVLESSALGVTRVSGTTGAVTVDIGTLPNLPSGHSGYALEKDSSLPLTVLSAQSSAPDEGLAYAASYADVNRNGRIEADDAMFLYHAFESAGPLGDGENGGTAQSRQTLLSGLAGVPDPNDDELREMLGKANKWRQAGLEVGGDINGDGLIDGSDALAMYYAFEFENLVGNGETGGTTRFRRSLLSEHAAQANPGDADLKAMLRNAHALRAAAAEAAQ